MKDFWFEIIRRSRNRYEWVFVEMRDSRPRVLARSGRDYRSRKKTRRAIRRLQYAFPHAGIRDVDRFRLPYTRFEIVPGVLPLRVQAAPSGHVPASARASGFGVLTPARTEEPETMPAEQPEQPPAEEEQQAQEQKPVAAGRRRRAT